MDNLRDLKDNRGFRSMPKRVVASYCTTFLKPEMLHIYRQVRSLHEYDTFVMTKAVQNIERFPLQCTSPSVRYFDPRLWIHHIGVRRPDEATRAKLVEGDDS